MSDAELSEELEIADMEADAEVEETNFNGQEDYEEQEETEKEENDELDPKTPSR